MKIGSNASGPFTAEEILTVAGLHLLHPTAEIVRTHDEEILATCVARYQTKWVTQAARAGIYRSFADFWEQCNLQLCGRQFVTLRVDRVLTPFDRDATGKKLTPSLVASIEAFNVQWKELRDPNAAYQEALRDTKRRLERLIVQAKADDEVESYATAARKLDPRSQVLVLNEPCPWERLPSTFLSDVRFIVIKSEQEGWNVHGAKSSGRSTRLDPRLNEYRYELPHWPFSNEVPDGQKTLVERTGVADAISVASDYFSAHAASKEGALALAKLALKG